MSLATRVVVAAVGVVVGWAGRVMWPQPEAKVEDVPPSFHVERLAEAAGAQVRAAPSVSVHNEQVVAHAVQAGCDCPRSVPPGTDPLYQEPAVTAWFDDVMANCPAFAARARRRLDCSEWPCMLAVSDNDEDMLLLFQDQKAPGTAGKGMTCGIEGPNLVTLGGHGLGRLDWYFAIRPEEPDQDHRREGIRMFAQRPDNEPPR